jgi:Flp pilus assembly protein TadD
MTQEAFTIPELADEAVEALMYVASMAYNSGKFENAYKVYRGASIARPADSRAIVGMGVSLYCLGRTEEAEAAYRQAIALNAKDQEAHLYLGELIWNERKDSAEAETHLNTAFRIHPKNRIGARARFILSSIKTK